MTSYPPVSHEKFEVVFNCPVFFFSLDKNNTEKPAYLCILVMIFAEHIQLHCQGNLKCSLPELDSKIEATCSDCLHVGFPVQLFEF